MLDCALTIGCEISIRCGGEDLSGIVRHCARHEAGFLLGVEFYPDSQWSSKTFRPRHLLDPQDMFSSRIYNRSER